MPQKHTPSSALGLVMKMNVEANALLPAFEPSATPHSDCYYYFLNSLLLVLFPVCMY